MYVEYNQRYWGGKLPQYHVRRKRLPGLQGLTDDRRRTIWLDSRIQDGELLRQNLLHEMCHVAEGPQKVSHGPVFWKQLDRLAAHGESWAAEQLIWYSDDKYRHQMSPFKALRTRLQALLLTENGPHMPWRRVKIVVAHGFGISIREIDRRFPRLQSSWRRLQRDEMRTRASEEALDRQLRLEGIIPFEPN
jgi:hypothetical protein